MSTPPGTDPTGPRENNEEVEEVVDPRVPETLMRDRVIVSAAAVLWIVGTLLGFGVIGGTAGVQEQGEGLFSDSATLIAPHGPAFSIWSLIYLLLAGYVVWQWLPRTDASRWASVTRVPAACAIGLNGLWLIVVFAGWVLVSVLVIAAIAACLGMILQRTSGLALEGPAATVLVSGTFGLYLGWVCVATCANIASWLVGAGVPATNGVAVLLTLVVLAVVLGLAAFLLDRTDQPMFRLTFTLALSWGIAWVAVGRFVGDLQNAVVGVAAVLTVLGLVGLWGLTVRRDLAASSERSSSAPEPDAA